MNKNDALTYWIASSDRDYQAMIHLHEKGDYTWSLFVGHLVVEKLLKACYVFNIDLVPPFTHDLVRLSEKAGISLSEDQKDLLDTISTFNISARYDDYRSTFHRKCTRDFTGKWIHEIEGVRLWLKDKLPKQQ